jgi:hypothetical protein
MLEIGSLRHKPRSPGRSSPSVANALINTRQASVFASMFGWRVVKSQKRLVPSWYACSLIASRGAEIYAGEFAPLPPVKFC